MDIDYNRIRGGDNNNAKYEGKIIGKYVELHVDISLGMNITSIGTTYIIYNTAPNEMPKIIVSLFYSKISGMKHMNCIFDMDKRKFLALAPPYEAVYFNNEEIAGKMLAKALEKKFKEMQK